MIFIFSISVLVIFYMFLGYPIILFFLSIFFGKKINRKEILPKVSIIISAYNEEKIIRDKIENSLDLDYPREKLEIIVASESTDGTNDIVKEYQKQGVVLYAYKRREGKRATLYKTVPRAKGDIVVFSDANAMYKRDAIKKLVRNFADERIGCVSGRLTYLNSKGSSIGKGENTYWEFDFLLKKMASRLFSLAGCGGVNGSIFAIRKECYNPIDKYRGDDFEISCRVELGGKGVVLDMDAISYEESSEHARQEFNRKVRLSKWNAKSSLLLLKEALKKKKLITAFLLFSHRFLRYTTPFWLILLFTSCFYLSDNNFFKLLLIIQVVFYSLALIGWILERLRKKMAFVFLIPFYFCMVNIAAMRGILSLLFKGDEVVWDKAR